MKEYEPRSGDVKPRVSFAKFFRNGIISLRRENKPYGPIDPVTGKPTKLSPGLFSNNPKLEKTFKSYYPGLTIADMWKIIEELNDIGVIIRGGKGRKTQIFLPEDGIQQSYGFDPDAEEENITAFIQSVSSPKISTPNSVMRDLIKNIDEENKSIPSRYSLPPSEDRKRKTNKPIPKRIKSSKMKHTSGKKICSCKKK